MKNFFSHLFQIMDFIAKMICSICAFAFFALIIYQVVCRFFLKLSVNWTDELCRYSFFVMVMVGAILCINENGHFSIDIAAEVLPKKINNILVYIVDALSIVFLLYLAYSGYNLGLSAVNKTSNFLEIPMSWLYYTISVCAILMIVYVLRNTAERIYNMLLQEEGGKKKCLD